MRFGLVAALAAATAAAVSVDVAAEPGGAAMPDPSPAVALRCAQTAWVLDRDAAAAPGVGCVAAAHAHACGVPACVGEPGDACVEAAEQRFLVLEDPLQRRVRGLRDSAVAAAIDDEALQDPERLAGLYDAVLVAGFLGQGLFLLELRGVPTVPVRTTAARALASLPDREAAWAELLEHATGSAAFVREQALYIVALQMHHRAWMAAMRNPLVRERYAEFRVRRGALEEPACVYGDPILLSLAGVVAPGPDTPPGAGAGFGTLPLVPDAHDPVPPADDPSVAPKLNCTTLTHVHVPKTGGSSLKCFMSAYALACGMQECRWTGIWKKMFPLPGVQCGVATAHFQDVLKHLPESVEEHYSYDRRVTTLRNPVSRVLSDYGHVLHQENVTADLLAFLRAYEAGNHSYPRSGGLPAHLRISREIADSASALRAQFDRILIHEFFDQSLFLLELSGVPTAPFKVWANRSPDHATRWAELSPAERATMIRIMQSDYFVIDQVLYTTALKAFHEHWTRVAQDPSVWRRWLAYEQRPPIDLSGYSLRKRDAYCEYGDLDLLSARGMIPHDRFETPTLPWKVVQLAKATTSN